MQPQICIDHEKITAFCRKWKITEFSLFGSVLREDFGPESDVDVLVILADDAHWSLFDLVDMEDELRSIFGRDVDLLTRPSVEGMRNYLRRRAILSNMATIYAA
ncbi:MAG: nucleotidyltransferase family protein [Calditrichaeota bacterium]|nr:nucleotidyltransferase family protein [Calditrichota bacterium]